MTGTKLTRALDTPAHRANLAAQVASRAEDAATAAETHAEYSGAAAMADDADVAYEHHEGATLCAREANGAVEYIQAIHACADGDGYDRAIKAASRADKAAKKARQDYESAACNADEAHMRAMVGEVPEADRAAMRQEIDTRIAWLRLLYLLRQNTPDVETARKAGIIPLQYLHEARAVFDLPDHQSLDDAFPF